MEADLSRLDAWLSRFDVNERPAKPYPEILRKVFPRVTVLIVPFALWLGTQSAGIPCFAGGLLALFVAILILDLHVTRYTCEHGFVVADYARDHGYCLACATCRSAIVEARERMQGRIQSAREQQQLARELQRREEELKAEELRQAKESARQAKLERRQQAILLARSLDGLCALDPFEFESAMAELLAKLGWVDVSLTRRSGDRGVDIAANNQGIPYVVQCKRYTPSQKISSEAIRNLHGAMAQARAKKALFITTSTYTREARAAAEALGIELWDGNEIAKMCKDIL